MRKKRDLHVGRHDEVAQVFRKLRNVQQDSSKNPVLNLELSETETVLLMQCCPAKISRILLRFQGKTKRKM